MPKKLFEIVTVLFLVACLLFDASRSYASAVEKKLEIMNGLQMRLAGTHVFTARTKSIDAKEIAWSLDREEKTVEGETVWARNLAAANGKQVSFELTAKPDTETVYHVRAEAGGLKDEFSLRVFPPNARAFFTYRSAGNPDVKTYIVVPSGLSSKTQIVMVMHGRSRNADGYIQTWAEWASRNNRIALAPEFDGENWKGGAKYNLGNIFADEDGAGAMNPEANWSFTIVENIHALTRREFGVKAELFDLWGHSAGGQFVHRFMLFKPNAKVRYAMPANAGWYTTPNLSQAYPYGVSAKSLSITKNDLKRWTQEPVIIFRGTADVERTENLSMTPEADAQGQNRYERAGFMYGQVKAFDPKTKWQLIDVPGSDHSQRKMAPAAQQFLEKMSGENDSAKMQAVEFYREADAIAPVTMTDWERRRKLLEESVRLDRTFAPALAALASLYAKTGRAEESAALLRKALKIYPDSPIFYSSLGYVYRYAGLLDESIELYRKSQTFDQSLANLIDTEEQITKSLIYKGDYTAALASHERIAELYKQAKLPHDHKELFYAGVIHFYLKNYREAGIFFDRAAEIDGKSIWSLFGQTYKTAASGRSESLFEKTRQLETLDIIDGERRYRLAHFYALGGERADALRSLQKAIENGFFNYPYISRDALLANISQTSEFQDLIGIAKKRHDVFKQKFSK